MARKLLDSNGMFIGCIDVVRKTNDDRTRVYLSSGHMLEFGQCDLAAYCNGNLQIIKHGSYHRDMTDNACYVTEAKKMMNEVRAAMNAATIKNVIFAPPDTIVYWSDGSKTVVKCSENDIFDPEKGLAMAIAKRCAGNKGNYYKEIRNWVEKDGKKYPGKPAAGKAVDLDVLKKYSSEANKDCEKFLSAVMSNNQSGILLHLTALVADLKILENEINK